ncbi:nicotinate-nucleotide--dimethylbenzimidazole phosphoribosyltransferase [Clostridium senegalense]|uniref:nicotinate-nucleotide--dimethylbenzimidazole phosphoribosyltransferase n=1 Tax=Clostridium senegalense TaxID=1465809 RepID=UPI001C11805C|nr:nicotinate-nucleotide--dimethylbenzimidazole phosphoribosyltransferase [Clostridium senegalense]MBU5226087.1 nicotinate-nucleotide--dimethylbenzimidazole phosphoribosyltransferase [Clostridium senegalense]
MKILENTLRCIEPSYKDVMIKTKERLDALAKPIGSLGILEEIAVKISGITGEVYNTLSKKNIIIICGDNGVVDEGVSTCPQEVTETVTYNFVKGITGVCALSKFTNTELTIADLGIKCDMHSEKILNRKISYGTKNMVKEPAMTKEQTIRAIESGIEIVDKLAKEGYKVLGTGEMGIGNTTTSAAVLSVLSGLDVDKVTGKGSGLTEEQLNHKKNIIKKAIAVNKPDKNDIIDVIGKVGGYDIAGLCGCFLGAAKHRIPIVIDGFIASISALCAQRLNKNCKDYMFPSHLSAEPGAIYIMKELGLEPILNLKMRLGEGSGCPLAFNIMEAALYTMENMATFEEAKICKSDYIDIREENSI